MILRRVPKSIDEFLGNNLDGGRLWEDLQPTLGPPLTGFLLELLDFNLDVLVLFNLQFYVLG